MLSDTDEIHYTPSIRLVELKKTGPNLGFKLTRSKWDPYPWISSTDAGTPASAAGLQPGDCLLEVNGEDVIGQKIAEIAETVRVNHHVSLLLWNSGTDPVCTPETMCCGPMPTNLQRLSACMSMILTFLECPVCLDSIPPPCYQCENGHLICIKCRAKAERCPICRLRYGRGRSLVADQVYNSLVDAFNLREETSEGRTAKMQEIFKLKNKNKNIPDIKIKPSHTNNFLARIVGKSSSVDNLSNEKLISECTLKVKSLSNHEIFQNQSPAISRASSVTRLSRNEKNNKFSSCHGSFESLQTNLDKEELFFYCPFAADCISFIKGDAVMEHFQLIHDGPLIQYFKPNIKINYHKIFKHENLCFVIQLDKQTFFFKIELDGTPATKNILLWTWLLGAKKEALKYETRTKILYGDSQEAIVSTCNKVFSLNTVPYQEIKESKKGILINPDILKKYMEPLAKYELVFNIDIVKSDSF